MEASQEHRRAKRGCWWFIGISIAGACGVLVLLVAIAVFSPDGPKPGSIVVSADDHTYLEVVNEQRRINGEGFLADYVRSTAVYYIQVGGWFRDTKRMLLFESGDINPQDIHFHRSSFGEKENIEVIRCIHSDSSFCDPVYSVPIFIFPIPKNFNDYETRAPIVSPRR